MNAYEHVREAHYNGTEDNVRKQTLALAYLQLHLDNIGLHPDDHLDPESGYCGWHVLLVHRLWTEWSSLPDRFRYPTDILRYATFAYEQLMNFHTDDDDSFYRNKVESVRNFLVNMSVENLDTAVRELEELVLFHDGAPEEVFEVISGLCEVLNWVNQLSN